MKKENQTMKYEEPSMEVIYLEDESVYTLDVVTSGTGDSGDMGEIFDLK